MRLLGVLIGVVLFSSAVQGADHAAIAYSEATGNYGFAFNYRSATDAMVRAIAECRKHRDSEDCRLVQGVASAVKGKEYCAALAVLRLSGKDVGGQPKTFRWLSSETAPTQRQAEAKAMETCQEKLQSIAKEPAVANCQLVVGVCSGSGSTPVQPEARPETRPAARTNLKLRDWRMDSGLQDGKPFCGVAAALIDAENGKQYIFGYTRDPGGKLVIHSPGSHFTAGQLQVDNGRVHALKCAGPVCYFGTAAEQAQAMTQMKQGKSAIVNLDLFGGGKAGPFAFPLDKFASEIGRISECRY